MENLCKFFSALALIFLCLISYVAIISMVAMGNIENLKWYKYIINPIAILSPLITSAIFQGKSAGYIAIVRFTILFIIVSILIIGIKIEGY